MEGFDLHFAYKSAFAMRRLQTKHLKYGNVHKTRHILLTICIQMLNLAICLQTKKENSGIVNKIDEKIGDVLGYAVSKKYGYLTSSPSDLGTGLRFSGIKKLKENSDSIVADLINLARSNESMLRKCINNKNK